MDPKAPDGQHPVTNGTNLEIFPEKVVTTARHAARATESDRLKRWLLRQALRALRGGLGNRISRRQAIGALVTEQERMGGTRSPETTSYIERLIEYLGQAAGNKVLAEAQGNLDGLARQTDALRAEEARLLARREHIPSEFVHHPDGGMRTVTHTVDDHNQQRAEMEADRSDGSLRHRRLSEGFRRAPSLIVAFDALLLFYFFSGVTDVDWSAPFSWALVFAVILAGLVTSLSFLFFCYVGNRLRYFKNDAGSLSLAGADVWTLAGLVLAAAAVTVLAGLMFVRMRAEVLDALGSSEQGIAILIGVVLAVVSILANFLIIAVHAIDGSVEADRLDALGMVLEGPLNEWQALSENIKDLRGQIAMNMREAERIFAMAKTQAGSQLAEAQAVIETARGIHGGTGWLSGDATDPNSRDGIAGFRSNDGKPQVDTRAIEVMRRHIDTPLPLPGDEAAA